MAQIIINNESDKSQLDALHGCIEFINQNIKQKTYMKERSICLSNWVDLNVREEKHPNEDESPCSVIFYVS